MGLRFTKMQALGNDFMVVQTLDQSFIPDPQKIQALADRHLGVGFDQLLILSQARSADADFFYQIYNADGTEVAQCGNGARVVSRFIVEKQLKSGLSFRLETLNRILISAYDPQRQMATVDMGIPDFEPAALPFLQSIAPFYQVPGQSWTFSALSMGNPHAVIMVEDWDLNIRPFVEAILDSNLFPQGVNMGFMQIEQRNQVRLRVFERGVGETLACGSGACAAAVAGIQAGLLDSKVELRLKGGHLAISWQGLDQPVFMTGPAETVFEGELP